MQDMIDHWESALEESGLKRQSIINYRSGVRTFFRSVPLDGTEVLTMGQLKEYIERYLQVAKRTRTTASYEITYYTLKRFLDHCGLVANGHQSVFDDRPSERVDPQNNYAVQRFLPQLRLVRTGKARTWQVRQTLTVLLFMELGCMPYELYLLSADSIAIDRATIAFAGRSLLLAPLAHELMRIWWPHREGRELWTRLTRGSIAKPMSRTHFMVQCRQATGWQWMKIHQLRVDLLQDAPPDLTENEIIHWIDSWWITQLEA